MVKQSMRDYNQPAGSSSKHLNDNTYTNGNAKTITSPPRTLRNTHAAVSQTFKASTSTAKAASSSSSMHPDTTLASPISISNSPYHSGQSLNVQNGNNRRRKPLTIREYEADFRQRASDLQLVERVYQGGMDGNQLRAALWPLIFGLVKERGRFIRKSPSMSSINGHSSSGSSSSSSSSSTTATTNGHHRTSLSNGHHHHSNNHQHHHHHHHNGKLATSNGTSHKLTNGTNTTTNGLTLSSSSPAFLPFIDAGRRRAAAAIASAAAATGATTANRYVYIEHEENLKRWRDLERQYRSYESQWKSIQPEQELRFSVFRERKALIERDVIRSDRSHPFYADNSANLKGLTTLLMTYMMYDFDIGYLQGMSDLAAPILFVFQGNLVKSFWVFVEVMKLFRRNFEYSQKTIHFQLNCLYRLVKLTDAKLAKHLRNNECSNCFFVFRCIVCQFKRELMKDQGTPAANQEARETNGKGNGNGGLSDGLTSSAASSSSESSMSDDDDDRHNHHHHHHQVPIDDGPIQCPDFMRQIESNYSRVLNLWDTIWCVQRRHELLAKTKCVHTYTIANGKTGKTGPAALARKQEQVVYTKETFYSSFDPNQADVPRFELTETEKFVLSLCLSLIRRERNAILTNQMDATEIHQHFINPRLSNDFDAFVEQAYKVYDYLNTDCDLKKLVRGASELAGEAAASNMSSPSCANEQLPDTADTYELLKDYLIISPTAYNISMTSLNNINQKGSPLSNGTSPRQQLPRPLPLQSIRRNSSSRYSVSQKSWDHFLNSETLQ